MGLLRKGGMWEKKECRLEKAAFGKEIIYQG